MPIKFAITGDNKGFLTSMEGVRNSVRSTMQDVEKSGMGVEQMFDRLKRAAALSFAGISAKELISDIMDVRGQFQQLEVAFKTMLGSEQAAQKLMDQLVKTAATTPFDLKGVADGAKQLLAYGTAVDDVNEMIIRLGDVAAGMSIQLGDLVYLYGTTMVQGRMFTQDLRQFQGRGIPIAEEIAKVLNVTKNQVPELVTAGKVTAEVFHQAFINMTNEGSKFGGLMKEQSKTIVGQISNIEDAVDMMFNDMGKRSEGVINAGLGTVSYLVENWQKVGEAIGVAAVAIGSYKAVMVAVNAIQKANNALMAESAVQQALATAAGHALTAGQARQAAMDVLLTNARRSLIVATKELAAATLMNPYVWAAAAITTLVVLTYKLATAEDAETIARRRANDEMQKFADGLDEQKNKIQGYIQTLQDASATEYDKAVAWEMLSKAAPTLTEKYSKAEVATMDLAQANRELNQQMNDATFEHVKQQVEEWRVKLEETKKAYEETIEAAEYGYTVPSTTSESDLIEVQSRYDEYVKRLVEIQRIRQEIAENSKPLEIKIQEANENVQAKEEIYKFYKKAADLAGMLKEAHDIAEGTISNTNIPTDYEKVAEDVRKKYDDLISDLQEEVEDLRKKVAESPADIKLRLALEEKQKALDDILNMKAGWVATGATTIPLYFQIHYKEAEEGLENARNNGKEGMYFNYVTGKYERSENAAPTKTAAQWKADAYTKWKAAEKALDDYYNQKDEVDKETFDKKVEQLQADVDDAKKQYQKYGGSTSGKKGGTNDVAKRRAAALQEERRWQEELDDLRKRLDDARSDVRISYIRNEGERERAEQDEQHRRNIRQIEEQAEEMKKAVYEHDKRVWENAHKDGVYEDTAEGKAGWQGVTLSEDQNNLIKAQLEKEQNDYSRIIQQRYVDELTGMYDYLKQYGTLEQQRYAISKEYDRRIAEEHSKSRKMMLEADKKSALSRVNAQAMAMSIDWNQVFGGIGNVLEGIARETLQKVDEYMNTKEFKELDAADKKAYYDLRSQLVDAGGIQSASPFKASTWDDIAKYADEYKQRVKDFLNAQETHKAAVDKLIAAEKELQEATTPTAKMMAQMKVDMANQAVAESSETVKKTEEEKNKANQNLKGATDSATQGLRKFDTILGQLTSGSLGGFATGIYNLINQISGSGKKVAATFSEIGGKVGGIIGAILQIIDALGEDPAQFIEDILNKIANVIEAILKDLPQIIANVVQGVGNIIGGVVSGIGGLFGFDMSGVFGGGTKNFEAATKKWGWLLDTWKDNLKYEKKLMEEAYGEGVSAIMTKTERDLELTQKAAAEMYRAWASDGAGWFSHSNGYEANRDANWGYLWESDPELAKRMGAELRNFMGTQFQYVANGDISRLFDLSADELRDLKYSNRQFWQSLSEEARKYLDMIIEADDEMKKDVEEAREQLTGMSFDSLTSDFKSQLMDMDSDAKTFTEKFEKYMQNAIISSLMLSKYKARLEQWYKSFAEASESGSELTKQEQEDLKKEYQDIVNDALKERDELRKSMGWSGGAYTQEASSKGFEAMSQDTGEELNGRFTALQISNDAISSQMILAVEHLTSIVTFSSSMASDVSEIRALVFTSTGYLEDMVRYAKLMYVKLGGSLEDIANNTKNL